MQFYRRFGKRLFDLLMSSLASLLLLIPGLFIALLIKAGSKGPVFFKQQRLGYQGRVFAIFKFRTMTHRPRVPDSQTFPDDPEVTKAGRFLRRFKLDEIPQFINVLRGDMSLIGPRPCLPELKEAFDENGFARLGVRPGLFGLADIRGGYYLTWPQRWVHDREYTERLSLWLDSSLALKVIPIILFDEDFWLKKNQNQDKKQ